MLATTGAITATFERFYLELVDKDEYKKLQSLACWKFLQKILYHEHLYGIHVT